MHGPGAPSATNPVGWRPIYTRPIRVYDCVATTIAKQSRRDTWKRALREALDIWEQAGLTFAVTEGSFAPYTGVWSATFVPVNAIRLVRQTTGGADMALWSPTGMGGACFFHPVRVWWKSFWFPSLRAHVAHELGHALGMWHWDGGIMGGGWKPDAHELESLRTYYGT